MFKGITETLTVIVVIGLMFGSYKLGEAKTDFVNSNPLTKFVFTGKF
jgi:Sec-independent protein translocase protein TatA